MQRSTMVATTICWFLAFGSNHAHADLLYGIELGGVPHRLFTFDTSTGNTTIIGQLIRPDGGHWSVGGLAFDSRGILYSPNVNTNRLYSIDANTAQVTDIGPLLPMRDPIGFEGFAILNDIGYGTNRGRLFQIDLATGNAGLVGAFDPTDRTSIDGLTVFDGHLYGTQNTFDNQLHEELVRLDVTTGAIDTVIGSHYDDILERTTALASDSNNFWIFTRFMNRESRFYSVDPTTASPTLLFSNVPIGPVAGLTSTHAGVTPVPEPGTTLTWLVAALVAATSMVRRRCCSQQPGCTAERLAINRTGTRIR